jgi:pterin-4a-carbinolamine dehydratase
VPFPRQLQQLIEGAHVTIALIGRRWMTRPDATHSSTPNLDYVVEELSHSKMAGFSMADADRYGLQQRAILPLFIDLNASFDPFDLPASLSFLRELEAMDISHKNWPTTIGNLLHKIAAAYGLPQRPSSGRLPEPNPSKAKTQPIGDEELQNTLRYDILAGWQIDNLGDAEARSLVKVFEFADFNEAAAFMALVSDHCALMDHHPDWRNTHRYVTVELSTWDAGRRVTIFDINLAMFMNRTAEAIGQRRVGPR